jgi:hypothetical protein
LNVAPSRRDSAQTLGRAKPKLSINQRGPEGLKYTGPLYVFDGTGGKYGPPPEIGGGAAFAGFRHERLDQPNIIALRVASIGNA